MAPRGRRTPASPPPPVLAHPPSSQSTTSGSSSLSPVKSAPSLSENSTNHDAEGDGDTQPEGSSSTLPGGQVDEDGDGDGDCPSEIIFRYPASALDFNDLTEREQAFKIARFVRCTFNGCDCGGLEPPERNEVVLVPREEVNGGVEMDGVREWITEEGWWRACGRCRHGWEEREGHVFPTELIDAERRRRGKVIGRIEELLQVSRGAVAMGALVDMKPRTMTY